MCVVEGENRFGKSAEWKQLCLGIVSLVERISGVTMCSRRDLNKTAKIVVWNSCGRTRHSVQPCSRQLSKTVPWIEPADRLNLLRAATNIVGLWGCSCH